MNLYDGDDGFRSFSLNEANATLPEVISVTEEAIAALDAARKQFGVDPEADSDDWEPEFETRTSDILETWSRRIVAIGAYPKGYFTVDFKSSVPGTLFCWTLGEVEIRFTHKINESFRDRIPIRDELSLGFERSLN